MTISGERTEQLDIFCHVTGFTSDFLSFIDVELIRFFHGALRSIIFTEPSEASSLHLFSVLIRPYGALQVCVLLLLLLILNA